MSRPAYVICRVCAVPVQTNPGSRTIPLHGAPKGVPIDAAHIRMAVVGGREIPVHVAKRRPACAGSLIPLAVLNQPPDEPSAIRTHAPFG